MLNSEKVAWNKDLFTELKDLYWSKDLIPTKGVEVHFVYGNRGSGDNQKVLDNLHLPEILINTFNFHFVKNSCHFPMLENPSLINNIIKSIV